MILLLAKSFAKKCGCINKNVIKFQWDIVIMEADSGRLNIFCYWFKLVQSSSK